MTAELKLQIELVPSTSWGSNLRTLMSTEDWDTTRRTAYRKYGHQCGVCSTDGMIHCHEQWEYDDKNHVQRLLGFIALCPLCHHVKHIGLAQILAVRGELDYDSVVEHFMRVNSCDRGTFNAHKKQAFEQWHIRSEHMWSLNLGEYASLVNMRRGMQ